MMRQVYAGRSLVATRPDVLFWRTDVVEPVVHELETPGSIRIDAEYADGSVAAFAIVDGLDRPAEVVESLIEFAAQHMVEKLDAEAAR